MNMSKEKQIIVMTFQLDQQYAAILTDGHRYRTYTDDGEIDHRNLFKAIAHLEAAGYSIIAGGLEIY